MKRGEHESMFVGSWSAVPHWLSDRVPNWKDISALSITFANIFLRSDTSLSSI